MRIADWVVIVGLLLTLVEAGRGFVAMRSDAQEENLRPRLIQSPVRQPHPAELRSALISVGTVLQIAEVYLAARLARP